MDYKIKVTAAERAEKGAWPFRPVMVEVTPDLVKMYFENTPAALNELLIQMLLMHPDELEEILDKGREDFEDFVKSTL